MAMAPRRAPRRPPLPSPALLPLLLLAFLPAAPAALDGAPSSVEDHRLRAQAMRSALSASPDVFPTPSELRSYHYFHAGVAQAAWNAAVLAGEDADALDEEREKHEGGEGAFWEGLERALEVELERVGRRLGELELELEAGEGDRWEASNAEAGDRPGEKGDGEEYTLEERAQLINLGAQDLFACDEHNEVSLEDVWDRLDRLRRRFWELVGEEIPPKRSVPRRDLYLDYISEDEDETQFGVYAGRPFREGEEVYHRGYHAVYFDDTDHWVRYLRSLPNKSDACLALSLSSTRRIVHPGRLLADLALDEGGFMRRVAGEREEEEEDEDEDEEDEEERGGPGEPEDKMEERGEGMGSAAEEEDGAETVGAPNVGLDPKTELYLVALRDIEEGEEIVYKDTAAADRADLVRSFMST